MRLATWYATNAQNKKQSSAEPWQHGPTMETTPIHGVEHQGRQEHADDAGNDTRKKDYYRTTKRRFADISPLSAELSRWFISDP